MSKINIEYYTSFTIWWLNQITKASTDLDTANFLMLASGMKNIVNSVFIAFKDFPELKGNGLSIALTLYSWIKANHDPFKETRELINKMRSQTLWQ